MTRSVCCRSTWTETPLAPVAAAIDIKNRLVELERHVADDGSPGRADALSAMLRRIGATVERFFDPRADGRGHARFAWLGGAEPVSVSSRLGLPNRVVFDSTPFIHPLLELADGGARRASF